MKKKIPGHDPEFDALLKLKKIKLHHLKKLSSAKQLAFRKLLTNMLAATRGEERDAFLLKIGALVEPDKIWEYNHTRIAGAITVYIRQFSTMPTRVFLAERTGLSHETINKHLRDFDKAPAFKAMQDMQLLMADKILMKLLQAALAGDVRAAKLYLNTVNRRYKPANREVVISNQNNYVQVNGLVLNDEILSQLKPAQVKQIEAVVKKGLAEGKKTLPQG